MSPSYCGIDLAVKRESAVAVMTGNLIEVQFLLADEEIINACEEAKVVAIDAPLTYKEGYREVDLLLVRRGLRVFPPSFIKALTYRGMELSKSLNAIETHPTSSFKILGWDWKDLSNNKDEADSVISAVTAYHYTMGKTLSFKAVDGEIHLLKPPRPSISSVGRRRYIIED
ncbi:DUF429 domain-containing protein [Metallosphaera tengchongensis]|uniref:DUF429 domain-containing protein n=1 Tax=Metallosphaera tengchongensis TaxID=1532350 RepID=A0A6N0NQY4_9CREN|nr:DUF429 domain-containing protein [Metallosphaera tengchongensis]QKQ99135.1 DUF429 domain-containing protein [Metallosphaera tengchongensis]